jgi:hypothetical protein
MRYRAFMEPSSENSRRGRPRAFSELELNEADERSILSPRHRQNRAYARRAHRRLLEQLWWKELSDDSPVPQCVLTELGRIKDEVGFGEAAWWYWYCGQNVSAKQAAAQIKVMRMGTTPQEGPTTLCERLLKTVNEFRVGYPDASLLYVEGQVELALEMVRRLRQHES